MSSGQAEKTGVLSVDQSRDSELPEGWVEIELADHVYVAGRIGWRGLKADEYTSSGPIILSVPNLNYGDDVNFSVVNHISLKRYDESPEIQLQVGDTLLVKDGAGIGKLGYVAHLSGDATVNSSLLVVRPSSRLLAHHFLFYYLKGPQFQEIALERITGSGTPHLFQRDIKKLRVLVPPPSEQRRIVAKIETLLKQVNATRARLTKVTHILKRFRQAVLAAACSGRLTEDWRERAAQTDDVAATVDAIRLRRLSAVSSPAQRKKLEDIYEYSEENDSDELPRGWQFTALTKLCASFDYGTSAKSQPTGRVPVLRMGNIQNGKIDWSDLVYSSNDEEIKRYALALNTVLFNRTNSPELVGKTALYEGERPAIFAGYLIRIVALPELDPRYLNLCLNTNYAREFCSRVKTDGVSQSNINAQKLGMFEVPYCPPAEQHEIVRRVESLFAHVDVIEKQLAAAQKRADRLTQAILAKAFRGELVPTEAEIARREGREYEPASALLARIKAERGTSKSEVHKTRRQRKVATRTRYHLNSS